VAKQQRQELDKQFEEEEEAAFMKEDPNSWDIFKDEEKFARRE